ncbi:MAG: hypothetical protein KIS66_03015 [Fimbriimonadaceae bacterium]|nr:hypothetical protein [Fimbriimonadaceae bacterium]
MVHLFMDVEDPINPLADDAALDLARLFTEAGVRGNFCVTGEKCRTLVARRRTDVLDALAPHCLGLHTDTHSVHPTTMELLADVAFEEGARLAYLAEKRGFDAFAAAFGRPPAFWGGAGNTWSPEITDALGRLGIPAYVYALTELPDRCAHRFNGVLAFTQHLSVSEDDWADDDRAARRCAEVLHEVSRRRTDCLCVFVGHPTRFRHERFWDAPYAGGRTPARPEPAKSVEDRVYEHAKANLASFLRGIAQIGRPIGLDDVLRLPWRFESPDEASLAVFRDRTAANLQAVVHWPIHRPGLDPAGIVAKTLALSNTLQVARLDEKGAKGADPSR